MLDHPCSHKIKLILFTQWRYREDNSDDCVISVRASLDLAQDNRVVERRTRLTCFWHPQPSAVDSARICPAPPAAPSSSFPSPRGSRIGLARSPRSSDPASPSRASRWGNHGPDPSWCPVWRCAAGRPLVEVSSSAECKTADWHLGPASRAAGSSRCACAPSGSLPPAGTRSSTSVAADARGGSCSCHTAGCSAEDRRYPANMSAADPRSVAASRCRDTFAGSAASPSGSPGTSATFVALPRAAVERRRAAVGLSPAAVSIPPVCWVKGCL